MLDCDTRSGRTPLFEADFDAESLGVVRRSVADRARTTSLAEDEIGTFVLAVNEIVANAVEHGGGSGSLQLWRTGTMLHCRISDEGPGLDPERARPADRPSPAATGGRGLWLAYQFCDVDITVGPAGTTVDLEVRAPQPLVAA